MSSNRRTLARSLKSFNAVHPGRMPHRRRMTMPYDYSDAPPPRDIELIPANTIATLRLHIRPGDVGEDGMLKRSKNGDCEYLDAEFVVCDGEHAKRKFWSSLVLEGTTSGQQGIAQSSRGLLKLMLDSAFGVKPDDHSPQERGVRTSGPGQL